jgi:WD40 repeat protein
MLGTALAARAARKKKEMWSGHHRADPRSAEPMSGQPIASSMPRASSFPPILPHQQLVHLSISPQERLWPQTQLTPLPEEGLSIMESAIRWSPSSTTAEQRFLSVDVTGKAFRLCKVTGHSASDKTLRHEVLSTLIDVPSFRAFDWSTSNENLIAVGQSSGEATILRLDASAKESLSFPVRNQRYCNAVAFSTHGLVASGLDRVRNDFCLNIWDVNQRLSPAGGTKGFPEPLRKLASSEPITSIKFFRDQPDTLVTGVKGQFVRIYDLRGMFVQMNIRFSTYH